MTQKVEPGHEIAVIDALQSVLDQKDGEPYCECKNCTDSNGYLANVFSGFWTLHKVKATADDSKERMGTDFIRQAKTITNGLQLNQGYASNVYLALFVKLLEKHKLAFADPGIQSAKTINVNAVKPTPVDGGFSAGFARPLPPRALLDRSRDPYLDHHYLCGAMETYHEARFTAPREPEEFMDIALRHDHIPDLTPMSLVLYETDERKLMNGVRIYAPMTKGWSDVIKPLVLPNKARMWQLPTIPVFTLMGPNKIPFVRISVSHFGQKTRVKRDLTIGVSFVACGCQRIPMEHRLD